MKYIPHLIGAIAITSGCTSNQADVEVWKSEYVLMESESSYYSNNFIDRSQWLYLYVDGRAELVDSTDLGLVGKFETSWKIVERGGKEIFLFGFDRESEGIEGVAYPIITKSETEFHMAFDSLDEHHRWDLVRALE